MYMESKAIEIAVQETKERCSKNGILRFPLIAIMTVFITCTACGKKQENPTQESEAETIRTTVSLEEADIEESELTGIDAVAAYAESMIGAENYVAYWDSAANRGTVLENGQEILPKAGDYFIVGGSDYQGFSSALDLAPDFDHSNGNHAIIPITEEWADASEQWVAIIDRSDHYTDYNFMNGMIEVVGEIRNIEGNELTGIEAVVAYARTLDCLGDNCLIYYDSTTKQGTVLKDGQEISPKVGDYILTIGSTFKGTYFIPGLEYNLDYYLEEYFIICPINEEFVNSDVITAGILDIDENRTIYHFTVAGENNGGNEGTTPIHYGEFLETTDRAEVCIVVTDMDCMLKDIILEDGDSYTLAEDELLYLYLPKGATSFSTTSEDAEIFDNGSGYIFLYVSFGTNMKIPISIEYADGTTEELTIYITR